MARVPNIRVKVDTTELDAALEKARQLGQLLALTDDEAAHLTRNYANDPMVDRLVRRLRPDLFEDECAERLEA